MMDGWIHTGNAGYCGGSIDGRRCLLSTFKSYGMYVCMQLMDDVCWYVDIWHTYLHHPIAGEWYSHVWSSHLGFSYGSTLNPQGMVCTQMHIYIHAYTPTYLYLQNAHRKVLDMLNLLGVSNRIMKIAESRDTMDKIIIVIGALITLIVLYVCWRWVR